MDVLVLIADCFVRAGFAIDFCSAGNLKDFLEIHL
jgi:hypothetical protein